MTDKFSHVFPDLAPSQRSFPMSTPAPRRERTADDVLWFIPNLIGYSRVVCALASFVLMLWAPDTHWDIAMVLYLGSFVGDLFDGMAARHFRQTSTFGSVLDMVTDRCATLGLLMILTAEYYSAEDDNNNNNKWWPWTFQTLALLDISSHWCQMYASLAAGGLHHKSVDGNANRNVLVQWFYRYYWFFGYLCVGAEVTYVLLYVKLKQHAGQATAVTAGLWVCAPGCVAKQVVNVAQLLSSCRAIAAQDAQRYNEQQQQQEAKKGK